MRAGFVLLLMLSTASSAAVRTKVAVLEMKPLDASSKVAAKIASEIVTTELSSAKRLNAISSSDIAAILGLERQKQLLGCADDSSSSCLAEISGALGARYLITGTLARIGKKRRFDLRLIDTTTSTVLAREGNSFNDETLDDEARAMTQKIIAAIPEEKPEPVAAPEPVKDQAPAVVVEQPAKETAPSKALPIALIAVGAVTGGAGAYLAFDALKWNQRKLELNAEQAQSTRAEAQTKLTAGYALCGVGAAALVGGIVLLATSGSSDSASIAVVPSRDGLFASATVRF